MTITLGKNNKHSLIFVILTFYLLFAPPIMGIHAMYFVAGFSWLYLILNNGLLFRSINKGRLQKFYLSLLLMFIWAAFLILINDGTRSVMFHYIYWMISIFPGALAIGLHTKKHGESEEYVLKLILWAGFIQSILTIAAFANNDIKLMFINKLQADDTLVMTTYTNEINYRLFGFSSGLTFDMPSAMAVIACIALYLAINVNAKYLFFVPTIAFSAVINARTSIVIIIISVFVLCVVNKKITGKGLRRAFFIVIAVAFGAIIAISILQKLSPLTFGWVESGINQLLLLFKRDTSSGYFQYLNNASRWILPKGLALIFGTGNRIMGGSKFGVYSDVGYVNDIWFGGLLYTIALYVLVGRLLWKVYRMATIHKNRDFLRFLSITYMICLPVLNVKTFIVSMGAFSTLFIIIMVIYTMFVNNIGQELNLYEHE